jgi:hypothetical protein
MDFVNSAPVAVEACPGHPLPVSEGNNSVDRFRMRDIDEVACFFSSSVVKSGRGSSTGSGLS